MSSMAIPKGNIKEDFCVKCKGFKRWNTWYNSTPSLCDDCSRGGMYELLTDEDARESELINNTNEVYVEYLNNHILTAVNSLEYYNMDSREYVYLMDFIRELMYEIRLIEDRLEKLK